ncbi:MAG: Alcohol dehydrogenase, partial [uncultured Sphingomonadaceae bacterium]
MIKALGYAAKNSFSRLKPLEFERDEPKAGEVQIEVLYCGVCHSDIHQAKNDWGNTVYPCMPGHEIVGRITRAAEGGRYKVGDMVGVGCMVDSCRACESCDDATEQYCEGPNGWLGTYNGPLIASTTGENVYGRDNTYGGYSNVMVVREEFVLSIPDALTPEQAAPILCAGVTTYSPMKHWGVKPGDKVGVIGLGGLGHMAVKIARAMGAEVTVFTTSPDKKVEAEAMGAAHVTMDKDVPEVAELFARPGQFDLMISTAPEKHDINAYVAMLKRDKSLVLVGALEPMAPVNNQAAAFRRRSVAGSLIGSIKETQE